MKKEFETERKFLLKSLPNLNYKTKIITSQYYLVNKEDDSVKRISHTKKYSLPDNTMFAEKFTYVKKVKTSKLTAEEYTKNLTQEEFLLMLKDAKSVIHKTRYIIESGNETWEIDQFHNIDLVMAEVEILSDNEQTAEKEISAVNIPDFISDNLIMEVSGVKEFSNYFLSIKM